MIVYLDDILIYSINEDEHTVLVSKVLKTLQEQGLTADISKYIFDAESVLFLDFVLFSKDVFLANNIIEVILDWAPSKSVKEVQVFLEFANFYRRFVRNFLEIAKSLSDITKSNSRNFVWLKACQVVFNFLKVCFTFAPILKHFNLLLPIHIKTDISNFVLSGTLLQYFDKNLYSIAFLSRKLSKTEQNYEIYDKEILVIINCFKQWRHYLERANYLITIYSNYKNLEYFIITK